MTKHSAQILGHKVLLHGTPSPATYSLQHMVHSVMIVGNDVYEGAFAGEMGWGGGGEGKRKRKRGRKKGKEKGQGARKEGGKEGAKEEIFDFVPEKKNRHFFKKKFKQT